ncbi:MAG TPA: hypothetical protein VFZ27_00055 [Terriglobia bacterium]|nr:hypothetical protein [Terriglobia bacterium]
MFWRQQKQKEYFFQKQSGEVAENKGSARKTNRNKPENKAEKLLKTRTCGKNKPKTNRKTKLAMLLKTQDDEKNETKMDQRFCGG